MTHDPVAATITSAAAATMADTRTFRPAATGADPARLPLPISCDALEPRRTAATAADWPDSISRLTRFRSARRSAADW
jgi:hypothetical protein